MLYLFEIWHCDGMDKAILKDVKITDGIVRGTQVGVFEGYNTHGDGSPIYAPCDPREYIAGGGAFTLVEFKEELA